MRWRRGSEVKGLGIWGGDWKNPEYAVEGGESALDVGI